MKPILLSRLGCAFLLAGGLNAVPAQDAAHHQHHHDAPASHEQLGQVSFPTSCDPKVQHSIERGVALLHSFGYTEAHAQFESIVREDPGWAVHA